MFSSLINYVFPFLGKFYAMFSDFISLDTVYAGLLLGGETIELVSYNLFTGERFEWSLVSYSYLLEGLSVFNGTVTGLIDSALNWFGTTVYNIYFYHFTGSPIWIGLPFGIILIVISLGAIEIFAKICGFMFNLAMK